MTAALKTEYGPQYCSPVTLSFLLLPRLDRQPWLFLLLLLNHRHKVSPLLLRRLPLLLPLLQREVRLPQCHLQHLQQHLLRLVQPHILSLFVQSATDPKLQSQTLKRTRGSAPVGSITAANTTSLNTGSVDTYFLAATAVHSLLPVVAKFSLLLLLPLPPLPLLHPQLSLPPRLVDVPTATVDRMLSSRALVSSSIIAANSASLHTGVNTWNLAATAVLSLLAVLLLPLVAKLSQALPLLLPPSPQLSPLPPKWLPVFPPILPLPLLVCAHSVTKSHPTPAKGARKCTTAVGTARRITGRNTSASATKRSQNDDVVPTRPPLHFASPFFIWFYVFPGCSYFFIWFLSLSFVFLFLRKASFSRAPFFRGHFSWHPVCASLVVCSRSARTTVI